MSTLRRAYEREVLARLLDHGMSTVDPLRDELLRDVRGRIVEIGFGSGANLPFYRAGVSSLVAVEPSEGLGDVARKRLDAWGRPHELVVASAMRPIPLDRRSFDAAVITFVLCSVRDVRTVLENIVPLVRSGGSIVLAEHVAAPARAQRELPGRAEGALHRALGGCDPARDTRRAIREAGLPDRGLSDRVIPLPFPVSSGLVGTIAIP